MMPFTRPKLARGVPGSMGGFDASLARWFEAAEADATQPAPRRRVESVMGRILIFTGLALMTAGFLWPWLSKLGLGRLPGDIRIEFEGGGLYFPLVTCLILSILVSLALWFLRR